MYFTHNNWCKIKENTLIELSDIQEFSSKTPHSEKEKGITKLSFWLTFCYQQNI